MRFLVNGETVAVTKAGGTAENPTIFFDITKKPFPWEVNQEINVFGEDGRLIKKMSRAEFIDYAEWAFGGGCPRFCPDKSLVA